MKKDKEQRTIAVLVGVSEYTDPSFIATKPVKNNI